MVLRYNEFEDVQAPTRVQWHGAELTVKWHLTISCSLLYARIVCSVIYYLNHTDHPPSAPFFRKKKAELYSLAMMLVYFQH